MIDRLSNRTALAIGVLGLLAVVLVGWFAVVSPWNKLKSFSSR